MLTFQPLLANRCTSLKCGKKKKKKKEKRQEKTGVYNLYHLPELFPLRQASPFLCLFKIIPKAAVQGESPVHWGCSTLEKRTILMGPLPPQYLRDQSLPQREEARISVHPAVWSRVWQGTSAICTSPSSSSVPTDAAFLQWVMKTVYCTWWFIP